jgi:hypothetical protein
MPRVTGLTEGGQYFTQVCDVVFTPDLRSELVKRSPRETRGLLGVSGKARESQYLGV